MRLCDIESLEELSGRTGHDDIVDVAVVEGALRRDDVVVTSDPKDISRIAASLRRKVRLEVV